MAEGELTVTVKGILGVAELVDEEEVVLVGLLLVAWTD